MKRKYVTPEIKTAAMAPMTQLLAGSFQKMEGEIENNTEILSDQLEIADVDE